MYGCQKTFHRGKGKQCIGQGRHGRTAIECRQRGFGRGSGGGRGDFHTMQNQDNPPVPVPAFVGATCPLCKNHCSLSEPGCPKGEAFAQSLGRQL
jgi:hypothetical protein